MVRTLKSIQAADVGQILREGTLFSLSDRWKRRQWQALPFLPLEYSIEKKKGKKMARNEKADLKWDTKERG